MLHNFGGNIEMYGVLGAVASGLINARTSENSTMVGVGMCMEGIEHNPVVYELMPEMAFRGGNIQLQVTILCHLEIMRIHDNYHHRIFLLIFLKMLLIEF